MFKIIERKNYNEFKTIDELKNINRFDVKEGQYASDLLVDLKPLKKGEDVIINLPLGSGKTYWALNNVLSEAIKKDMHVLYLVHRRTCLFQMMEDVQRVDKSFMKNIDFRTIQYLFNNSLKDKNDPERLDLNEYDLIIIDESHALMNSGWTRINQKIFDVLKKSNTQKIYISATNEDLIMYMVNKENFKQENIYYAKDDHKNIDKIFLYEESDIYNVIENLRKKDERSLLIINNSEMMREMSNLYKTNSMFGFAKSNKFYSSIGKYYKDDFEYLLKNKRFPNNVKLCFSTTFIDAGISILDEGFKNILIYGVQDLNTIKQITGRKRKMHQFDKVNVYLDNKSQGKISGFSTTLLRSIKYIEEFERSVKDEKRKNKVLLDHFLLGNMNPKQANNYNFEKYIYVEEGEIEGFENVKVKVNEISNYYNISNYNRISDYKELRWKGIIEREFAPRKVIEIAKSNKLKKLETTLKQYYLNGVRFYTSEDKRKFAEVIDYRVDGKLKRGLKNLNHALEVEKLPYRIKTKKENMEEMDERVALEEKLFEQRKIRKKDIKRYRMNYWAIVDISI